MRPEIVHQTGTIQVWRVISSDMAANCFLLEFRDSRTCVVIDPGLDAFKINLALHQLNLFPKAVLCTHGHFDHVGGANQLQVKYRCPVFLHYADIKTLESSNFLLMALQIEKRIVLPIVTPILGINSVLEIGGHNFLIILIPGHTPGSCAIRIENLAFTGDTLYSTRLGLSRLPSSKPQLIRESITSLFHLLPMDTMILPGHGAGQTLEWIRENNVELQTFLNESEDEGDPQ